MRSTKWFAAAAGIAALTVGNASAQELLSNALMDDTAITTQLLATPLNWVVTADTNDGMSSEPWNNVAGVDGKGVFVKTFQGSEATPYSASIRQDYVGVIPGQRYLMTGWVGSGPGYSGELSGSGTITQFALEFLDGSASVIGGSALDLSVADLTTVTGNPFDYRQYAVSSVAPAGAVRARVRFSMIDGYPVPGAGDAALVTDAYSLTRVPEPASVLMAGLGALGLFAIRRRR
ncbi:MAG: PEP-CTERM sorting domain-containing protein [Planctomycetales bacterium]|nr:PEP-CTERM sorting domain-containing protein [Planctomycetales bacterium]